MNIFNSLTLLLGIIVFKFYLITDLYNQVKKCICESHSNVCGSLRVRGNVMMWKHRVALFPTH